jgi:hypothetical protein
MGWVVNAAPRPLYPRERISTHCIGRWLGPKTRLKGCGKSCPLPGFDPRTIQPVASRYTDRAIVAQLDVDRKTNIISQILGVWAQSKQQSVSSASVLNTRRKHDSQTFTQHNVLQLPTLASLCCTNFLWPLIGFNISQLSLKGQTLCGRHQQTHTR